MVRTQTFRSLALGFTGAVEQPHHERTSFRKAGKIFATLAEAKGIGVVKLSVEEQGMLVESEPDIYFLSAKTRTRGSTLPSACSVICTKRPVLILGGT